MGSFLPRIGNFIRRALFEFCQCLAKSREICRTLAKCVSIAKRKKTRAKSPSSRRGETLKSNETRFAGIEKLPATKNARDTKKTHAEARREGKQEVKKKEARSADAARAPFLSNKEEFPAETQETQRFFRQDLQDGQDWAFGGGVAGNQTISGCFGGFVMGTGPVNSGVSAPDATGTPTASKVRSAWMVPLAPLAVTGLSFCHSTHKTRYHAPIRHWNLVCVVCRHIAHAKFGGCHAGKNFHGIGNLQIRHFIFAQQGRLDG